MYEYLDRKSSSELWPFSLADEGTRRLRTAVKAPGDLALVFVRTSTMEVSTGHAICKAIVSL